MANYNGQFQDSSSNLLLGTPHSYANIEGATASQAYVKGQMVVFNNRLCEVTAAIASGANFVVGTNIAYKNVGDIGKQLVANDGKGFYFDVKDGKYGFYPSASKVASEFVPFGGSADYSHLIGKVVFSYSNSDPVSTSGGLSVVGILSISGASSIKLSKTGGDNNATTATAYTASGATKSLTFGAYQDISGYDYIRFSASFSMSFPRDATVTLDDIT